MASGKLVQWDKVGPDIVDSDDLDEYLSLSGGTMTGTIVTPGDDSKGIMPARNNYGEVGAPDWYYYNGYFTNMTTAALKVKNTSSTIGTNGSPFANGYITNLYGTNVGSSSSPVTNVYGSNLYGTNVGSSSSPVTNVYGSNLYGTNVGSSSSPVTNVYGSNLYGTTIYENGTAISSKYLASSESIGHYPCHGLIFIYASGGYILGYGSAVVELLPKGKALVFVDVKITMSGGDQNFNIGIAVSELRARNSSIPSTLTPVTGGTSTYYTTSGAVDDGLTGYGGSWVYNGTSGGFWQPARIYTTTGSIGGWSNSSVAVNTRIVGVCVGTW